ncbi:MAG: acetate/propionate family kinase, partial [Leptolyngbyaceae cyanobacterium]
MNILILNAGSSSQKSCLYALPDDHLPDQPLEPLWEGSIDLTYGEGLAEIKVSNGHGVTNRQTAPAGDRTQLTQTLLQTLWQGPTKVVEGPEAIHGVGHRVVHGGQVYQEAARIDDDVMATIRELIPLAPVHNPANLAGIEIVLDLLGKAVPQFAIFDTAFHRSIPDAAAVYPGPQAWLEQGIRRYGFHGTSHEYCATRAATLLGKPLSDVRLITCHLGNGCSLAAVRDGQCVDTTMGFTPLEGLMMGTRSGSVDPGILFYLMREKGLSVDELDKMLNKQSGLKGLSGVSNDMRLLLEAIAQGNAQAKL